MISSGSCIGGSIGGDGRTWQKQESDYVSLMQEKCKWKLDTDSQLFVLVSLHYCSKNL